MANTPTTKTNNEYFSGSSTGSKVFAYSTPHVIVSTSGTVGFGFDGYNYMTLASGNHELYYINAKTIYFNGSGTWVGWGLG